MAKSKRVDAKKREPAALPKKKTPRRPDEVKARIIEAAISAFARQGFDGARMRAVAADAGISIQLLVHHVKSKDKLWRFMMEHIFEQYNQYMSKGLSSPSPSTAAKRLKQAITDLAHFTASMPQLHRIITAEAAHPTPRMLWLTERIRQTGLRGVGALSL